MILVGSGHSHLEVIRRYGELPNKPYRLTLINDAPISAYSGMLAALVANPGEAQASFVDLGHLCHRHGVRFINSRVRQISPATRELHVDRSPLTLRYDALSIDLGLRPDPQAVVGWSGEGQLFTNHLFELVETLERMDSVLAASPKLQSLVAIGADAPGLELLLSMAERYRDRSLTITLVLNRSELLPGLSNRIQQTFGGWLKSAGITIRSNVSVKEGRGAELVLSDGETLAAHWIYWGEAKRNPEILSHCGFKLNAQGQLAVNANLESSSHEGVYGAGDAAGVPSMFSISKTGIYGRQMGRILFENLTRRFTGLSQLKYEARSMPLTFFAYGKKDALGVLGQWSWATPRFVGLKARYDQKRMQSFCPQVSATRVPTFIESGNMSEAPCSASGASLPQDLLSAIPKGLTKDNIQALDRRADETILTLGEGTQQRKLLQAVTYHRSFTEDLFHFGRVTATHCLTSIYAHGLHPYSAHVVATIAFGPKRAMTEDLALLFDGVGSTLGQDEVALAGSHSQFGLEPGIGMMVQSLTDAGQTEPIWTPAEAQVGDVLVLTKPLGTGVLFAGQTRFRLSSMDFYRALEQMTASHHAALKPCRAHGVRASTACGGYGLAWHLGEMAQQSGVHVEIDLTQIPVYPGVFDALSQGIRTSLHIQNRTSFDRSLQGLSKSQLAIAEALFDPQTAAGIVLAVHQEKASSLIAGLHAIGLDQAVAIGKIVAIDESCPALRLRQY